MGEIVEACTRRTRQRTRHSPDQVQPLAGTGAPEHARRGAALSCRLVLALLASSLQAESAIRMKVSHCRLKPVLQLLSRGASDWAMRSIVARWPDNSCRTDRESTIWVKLKKPVPHFTPKITHNPRIGMLRSTQEIGLGLAFTRNLHNQMPTMYRKTSGSIISIMEPGSCGVSIIDTTEITSTAIRQLDLYAS